MIKLDNRLKAILKEIDNVEVVADIGCDHGKLIVSAILSQKAKKGIAVDISNESLKKAQILASEYDVIDKLIFLNGDGFLPIKDNIDIAVISGMGAREIVKILAQKDIANKYILVPHQDTYILRQYLRENSFFVIKDYIVKEQKFYPVIVAEKGNNNYTDREIYLGKNLPSTPVYNEWKNLRFKTIKKIIEKAGINAISNDLKKEWEELN
ncbi:MAG: SAM-dependent methyltransferase [Clostridiales bacterium]|nr:SAM-dependent methyltransferase [Clostridiales bacterium]